MDELFVEYAHFSLAKEHSKEVLQEKAHFLQSELAENDEKMNESELFDLIFVHTIEPLLPKDRLVVVIDYPYFSSCLAKEKEVKMEDGFQWQVKERWELYGDGLELCNCYTEERDEDKMRDYFEREEKLKEEAITPHSCLESFPKICSQLPECTGVAMGIDRLIMFLVGRKRIDAVIPFAF